MRERGKMGDTREKSVEMHERRRGIERESVREEKEKGECLSRGKDYATCDLITLLMCFFFT